MLRLESIGKLPKHKISSTFVAPHSFVAVITILHTCQANCLKALFLYIFIDYSMDHVPVSTLIQETRPSLQAILGRERAHFRIPPPSFCFLVFETTINRVVIPLSCSQVLVLLLTLTRLIVPNSSSLLPVLLPSP
jgi:hypothetical protein